MTISTRSLLAAGYRCTTGAAKGVNHERCAALWQKPITDEVGTCFYLSFYEFTLPNGHSSFHCEAHFNKSERPITVSPSIGYSEIKDIEEQLYDMWKAADCTHVETHVFDLNA